MKKCLILFSIVFCFSTNTKATIHIISVWNGYMQFLPENLGDIVLGDTINWVPLDPPTMMHTITSTNIPSGAVPFDQIFQLPADTFFQYIPAEVGFYQYECTPHLPMMVGDFNVEGPLNSSAINLNNKSIISYPNPANNLVNITHNLFGYHYNLINSEGSLVADGVSKKTIDISSLNPGVYHLIIFANKPKFQTIVVQ